MYIKNGQVFLSDGHFEKADILCGKYIDAVDGGASDDRFLIKDNEFREEEILDASGKYVIPGLVDIHTHGAVNADASDGDAAGLRNMSRYYAQKGVTSWCPTTMTLPEEELLTAMHAVRDFESDGAQCVGVHLEGPFVSYEKRGAQNAAYLQKPDIEELRRKYMDNPPEGMTSMDIRRMSEDELLDMDYFLNEDELDDYFGEEGFYIF